MEPCNLPFLEKADCVITTPQALDFFAFVVGELIFVPGYVVTPYLFRPGPFHITEEALAWDLMLVPYVPYKFLEPSILLYAFAVMAVPLGGGR